jgi:SAM-dependent methyltransferase
MSDSESHIKYEIEKEPTKKIFLEVGMDPYAMFTTDDERDPKLAPVPVGGGKEWANDEVWIGIEKSGWNLRETRDRERLVAKKSNIQPGQMLYVSAEGQKIPLADHTVETVFFGNAFGDPGIEGDVKAKFLEEAKRVLKPGGEVVILETRTAEMSRTGRSTHFRGAWYEHVSSVGPALPDLLKQAGFTKGEWIDSNDPRWKEIVARYSTKMQNYLESKGVSVPDVEKPFIVIARLGTQQDKGKK